MSTSIILASASPRRKELLERVGISCRVIAADVDESVFPGEATIPYAARTARAKAVAIATDNPGQWVLAADTVVEVDGTPMGKAVDRDDAGRMLRSLRGTEHRVTTAVCLCRDETVHAMEITSAVHMRDFSDAELQGYLAATEWQGKAGAYAVQGMAAAFVTQVRGSISNIIGLPLAEVVTLLADKGVVAPDYRSGIPS